MEIRDPRGKKLAEAIDIEQLANMAARAGLKLSAEEIQKLLPGVNRARIQVAELRQLIGDTTEPAITFSAPKMDKG